MKKLFKTNKGFTLVELIIVIAIIAILAAVLAPQFIRYVEDSREATDAQAAGTIQRAALVVSTDKAVAQHVPDSYTVVWDTAGTGATYDIKVVEGIDPKGTNEATEFQTALHAFLQEDDLEPQSTFAKTERADGVHAGGDFSFTVTGDAITIINPWDEIVGD